MFTPFALSIYRGALSPRRLGACGISSGQFLQTARQLELCDGTADALCACIASLVPGYSLPSCSLADVLSGCSTPISSAFSSFTESSSLLCPLRQAEMESTALTGRAWASHSPLAAFYAALLSAETRCLLCSLSQCFPRLHSAEEARVLLGRVLDEVYTLGVLVGDAASAAGGDWWRRMLKEGMASLYLDLTANFSYLLEADDFLDYPTLFSTSGYAAVCPSDGQTFARNALLYKVHIKGNKVRRLLSLHGRGVSCTVSVDELRACYDDLSILWSLLNEKTFSHSHLLSTLRALEDALYFATCPYTDSPVYDYCLLHDASWNSEQAEVLYDCYYSTHYRTSQSRSASHQLEAYLHHRSLAFLGDDTLPTGSIPRLLRQRIRYHLECYTRCYDATFRPLMPDKGFAEVPAPHPSLEPDDHAIHRRMSFFSDRKDAEGHPLMQPQELIRLEHLFLDFLRGKMLPVLPQKLAIPRSFNRIFYGFFFCFQQELGGDKELYAQFLLGVFVTDATVNSLMKNYARCIEAYQQYAHKAA